MASSVALKINCARCARPFVPFRIRMADGRSFAVDEPGACLICGRSLVVHFDDGSSLDLAVRSIASVEFPAG